MPLRKDLSWYLSIGIVVFLTLMNNCSCLIYRDYQEDCPDIFDLESFYTPYWEPMGTPYRAYKSLPWRLFSIKTSSIPNAGLGVFSTTFIPRNTWLGLYEGEIVSVREGKEMDLAYAWQIYTNGALHHYADGWSPDFSNWLRFINNAMHVTKENVVYHQCYQDVWYRTNKDIYPGEELFMYYGAGYAKDTLGIDLKKYFDKKYASSNTLMIDDKVAGS